MSQRPSMLIIDSRAREPGGSLDGFQILIAPAIEGIRGVSLLYASIAAAHRVLESQPDQTMTCEYVGRNGYCGKRCFGVRCNIHRKKET